MTALIAGGIVAACLGLLLLVFRSPLDSWNGRTWKRTAVESASVEGREALPYIVGVGALLVTGGLVLVIIGFVS